jgi:hypothetical protein
MQGFITSRPFNVNNSYPPSGSEGVGASRKGKETVDRPPLFERNRNLRNERNIANVNYSCLQNTIRRLAKVVLNGFNVSV